MDLLKGLPVVYALAPSDDVMEEEVGDVGVGERVPDKMSASSFDTRKGALKEVVPIQFPPGHLEIEMILQTSLKVLNQHSKIVSWFPGIFLEKIRCISLIWEQTLGLRGSIHMPFSSPHYPTCYEGQKRSIPSTNCDRDRYS